MRQQLAVAKMLGYTWTELTEKVTQAELDLWATYLVIEREEEDARIRKASRRGR